MGQSGTTVSGCQLETSDTKRYLSRHEVHGCYVIGTPWSEIFETWSLQVCELEKNLELYPPAAAVTPGLVSATRKQDSCLICTHVCHYSPVLSGMSPTAFCFEYRFPSVLKDAADP